MASSRSATTSRRPHLYVSHRGYGEPTGGRLATPVARQRLGNVLIVLQMTLIVLCLVPLGPTPFEARPWLGWGLIGAGAVVGVLALVAMGRDTRIHPMPAQGGRLHRNGIYAFVRHPMYTALVLATLGVTLASGRLLALLSMVGLVLVLIVKGRVEDLILQRKFGWEFAVYAARVPAVLPQPWRSHRR